METGEINLPRSQIGFPPPEIQDFWRVRSAASFDAQRSMKNVGTNADVAGQKARST